MPTIIRIFQGNKIIDTQFPEKESYQIGGTEKDDFLLDDTLKKGAILIQKKADVFYYTSSKIDGLEKEEIIKKEHIYVIDKAKGEAFALYDIDLSDLTIVDLQDQNEIIIGRKEECSIRIDSNLVSRQHAKLTKRADGWHIEDLKSANRTYVNGEAIENYALHAGDIIDISFCQLRFEGNHLSVRYSGKLLITLDKPIVQRPYQEKGGYPYAFKRSPRLMKEVKQEHIEIQTAPMIGSAPVINWISVLLPSLGSVAVMATMVVLLDFSTISLYFSASMAFIGVLVAVLNYRSQKKNHREKEQLRIAKYDEYLAEIVQKIKQAHLEHRTILNEMHPNTKACIDMVSSVDKHLWEKRIQDKDFLTLRIGSGKVDSKVSLQIPKEFLKLEQDRLDAYPSEIKEEYQWVTDCPITIDVLRSGTVGIIGERGSAVKATQNLIVQATTHHSYDELKLVMLTDKDEFSEWEFVKWLPHTFDETRTERYMANDKESANKLLKSMESLVEQRYKEADNSNIDSDKVKPAAPYYLFIFTNYEMVKEYSILKILSANQPNAGVGALFLFDNMNCLPKECGMIVEVQAGKGKAYLREHANEIVSFTIDSVDRTKYDLFARAMAPIRIETAGKAALPVSVSFLQGYGLKRMKEYDIENTWKKGLPHKSMAVPIGVRENGEAFLFDINEKKHGPHGLIAGMTGSGKSEMVQTWILSMALNFSPDDVSFVLIDFKGTGLILPFRNLPHLAGTISDLDKSIGRNLIALENELSRRKQLLDAHGVSNISGYKKLLKEGKATEPLPYLFVVIDEFAEFKVQYPEFMIVVNRIFAIGRTLGVSIILLTQKPTNVVDEKMNANTRFRWCLKVASYVDSKDMIGHPDAAKITNPGRAIVKVGEDELYEMVQSYYSGAPYNPYKDPALHSSDKVSVVDLQGNRTSYEAEKTTGYRSNKNEIDAVVEALDEYVRVNGVNRARNIWVQKLPDLIYLSDVLSIGFDGVEWAAGDEQLLAVVGLVDDPGKQTQYPLKINLSTDGHLAVYGAPGTGKTTFMQTMILSLALSYSPEELHMYVMDFGGGNMQILRDLPHMGGIALADDEERLKKLSQMIEAELNHRKELFSSCGAMNKPMYEELTGQKLPYMILFLDNFAPVLGMYSYMDEFFMKLSREGGNYGIYWVVTANTSNTLTFRIGQNIKNAIALRMAEKADYAMIVGKTDGLEPENILGRGLIKAMPPLEFQTALPAQGSSATERIKNLRLQVAQMNERWLGERPMAIPVMPETVTLDMIRGDGIALGLSKQNIERLAYNPSANPFIVVSDGTERNEDGLVQAMYTQYANLDFEQFIYFDGQVGYRTMQDGVVTKITSAQDFDTVIFELMSVMQNRKTSKTANAEKMFRPIIVFLQHTGQCFEVMSDESANRINLLLTLGKNLDVMVIVAGKHIDLSKLYHNGVPFIVTAINTGAAILLGDSFRAHNIFKSNLSFHEQETVLPESEGYWIESGTATEFKAIG